MGVNGDTTEDRLVGVDLVVLPQFDDE